jgi:hypothetical protein
MLATALLCVTTFDAFAISSGDCQTEQRALVDNASANARAAERNYGYSASKTVTGLEAFVRNGVAQLLKELNSPQATAKNIKSNLDYIEQHSIPAFRELARKSRFGDDNQKLLDWRLTEACMYRIRLRELEALPSAEPSALSPNPPKSSPSCESAKVESINQKLSSIDEKVGVFMQSNAGQQTGRATEHLQVIMWAMQEQQNILQSGGCMDDEDFAAKARDAATTFAGAQKSCMQITSPAACVPKEPGMVASDYDKPPPPPPAQAKALNKLERDKSGDDCSSQGSSAGAVSCLVAECKKQGFIGVVTAECVVCGDAEGSMDGFMWRKGAPGSDCNAAAR